jgi:hypothetical protein
MSELWDAPNQQVVRADESHPSEEGTGGEAGALQAEAEAEGAEATDYESMTKDELLALAQERGISPANASMTKDELKAALEG